MPCLRNKQFPRLLSVLRRATVCGPRCARRGNQSKMLLIAAIAPCATRPAATAELPDNRGAHSGRGWQRRRAFLASGGPRHGRGHKIARAVDISRAAHLSQVGEFRCLLVLRCGRICLEERRRAMRTSALSSSSGATPPGPHASTKDARPEFSPLDFSGSRATITEHVVSPLRLESAPYRLANFWAFTRESHKSEALCRPGRLCGRHGPNSHRAPDRPARGPTGW